VNYTWQTNKKGTDKMVFTRKTLYRSIQITFFAEFFTILSPIKEISCPNGEAITKT
jgi:hypothetical protein